jgi:uncharacterized SAM-binding protein YcdF (DUF218 family)
MSRVKKVCLIVPLACDLAEQGRKLGPESIWRLRKALGVYYSKLADGWQVMFTFSAGMAPPKSCPNQTMSMSFLQRQFLSYLGVADQHMGYTTKPSWGSRAEMAEALTQANTMGQGEIEVIFVSSWYHLPRLRLLLRQHLGAEKARLNITISFNASRGRLINALKEPAKLLVQFLGLA